MEAFRFINIGFGNTVNAGKIIAIVSPDSAPIKRLVSKAREDGRTVDATQGRKTKAVLIMENDRIILSALLPETIRGRALRGARPRPCSSWRMTASYSPRCFRRRSGEEPRAPEKI